jgi:DNA replication protein
MSEHQLLNTNDERGLISLPGSFFTQVVPKIQYLAELKVVLYVSYLMSQKAQPSTLRSEGLVTYKQLRSEISRLSPEMDEEMLHAALDSAVEHGNLLHSTLEINGVIEDVYSLAVNSRQLPVVNIFSLYEQNIGMITPIIAEELKEAEKLYPRQWIEEAFKEAVTLNKRSWKYIARILERWASEGKDSGEHKGNTEKDGPDKYIKGRYGHLVKR